MTLGLSIIYGLYVYLVKLIYFIFFLWCNRLWWNKDEYINSASVISQRWIQCSIQCSKQSTFYKFQLVCSFIHHLSVSYLLRCYRYYPMRLHHDRMLDQMSVYSIYWRIYTFMLKLINIERDLTNYCKCFAPYVVYWQTDTMRTFSVNMKAAIGKSLNYYK